MDVLLVIRLGLELGVGVAPNSTPTPTSNPNLNFVIRAASEHSLIHLVSGLLNPTLPQP